MTTEILVAEPPALAEALAALLEREATRAIVEHDVWSFGLSLMSQRHIRQLAGIERSRW